jgi:F-type H+-transporting ATPase subunit b
MLVIVKRFLYQPIKTMLDTRANLVRSQLDEAAVKEKAAKLLQEKLEKEAKQTKADLQRIRQEAQDEIDRTKQQLLSDAQLQASMLKQKANEEIILAKQKALAQIEEEIIQVALSATSQLLKREVSPAALFSIPVMTSLNSSKGYPYFLKNLSTILYFVGSGASAY